MAKATLKLANGTTVVVEGTPEEVQRLLELNSGEPPAAKSIRPKSVAKQKTVEVDDEATQVASIHDIVNLAKSCDEADAIEKQILDKTSQLNRTLLPLYLVHEHLKNEITISSGDVQAITKELGVPMSIANASRTLSGAASKYVMGDKVRRPGQPVGYKLNRRGVAYMKSVLTGSGE